MGSVHNPINSLAAYRQPHLKHLGLKTSHLAPAHRGTECCRAYSLSSRKAEWTAEGSCRARGDCSPCKDLTQKGAGLPYRSTRVSLAPSTAKSKKVECELPLICATQGRPNWWTKGLGGRIRTLRNWTGSWTTVKSVTPEGRKVKPIPPTTPSCFSDKKTSRTDLTGLKQAEDLVFLSFFSLLLPFCPSFFFYSFFLPSFTFLMPSSCLLLFIHLF